MLFSWDGFTLSLPPPALRPLHRHNTLVVVVCCGVGFGIGMSVGPLTEVKWLGNT